MARIEPLHIHEVDEEIRHFCEEAERQSGTSASTLAREGTLDPVLRELVRLKIAVDHHKVETRSGPRCAATSRRPRSSSSWLTRRSTSVSDDST